MRTDQAHREKERILLFELGTVGRALWFRVGTVFEDGDGLVGGQDIGLGKIHIVGQDHTGKAGAIVQSPRKVFQLPRCQCLRSHYISSKVPRIRVVRSRFSAFNATGYPHMKNLDTRAV